MEVKKKEKKMKKEKNKDFRRRCGERSAVPSVKDMILSLYQGLYQGSKRRVCDLIPVNNKVGAGVTQSAFFP